MKFTKSHEKALRYFSNREWSIRYIVHTIACTINSQGELEDRYIIRRISK